MKQLFLFISLISIKVVATPQIPDILLYNGKKYEWNSYSPARDYLEKNGYKTPVDAIETTANTGFYNMTYSIENDSLFLTDITILTEKNSNLDSRSIFKDFFQDRKKVFMQSYSKIQTLPYGKAIEVKESNLTETYYPNYLVLEFKNGIIEKEFDLDYNKFRKLKRNLFSQFKRTAEYTKLKKEEVENLEEFNEFKSKKMSMDNYLEFRILSLVKTLKE